MIFILSYLWVFGLYENDSTSFRDVAPGKLAVSTLVREKQDVNRFLPYLGQYKLKELRPEHFRKLYAELRKAKNLNNGKPLSEATVEGVHACLCGILSDAMEGGFLDHNPAWRTYRYSGTRKEIRVADEATTQKIIAALENESLKYETYFKLIIATGMRRGECCGLKWGDINYAERSIHVCRNVVKLTGEDIVVKSPKTKAGDRYVYFTKEMESLLREHYKNCVYEIETYDKRKLTDEDFIFRRREAELPMTPTTFTFRFKQILKKNGLPENLNVPSLRHPYVKHTTQIFSSTYAMKSFTLYTISMRLSGNTYTLSTRRRVSSEVRVSATDSSLNMLCRSAFRACAS